MTIFCIFGRDLPWLVGCFEKFLLLTNWKQGSKLTDHYFSSTRRWERCVDPSSSSSCGSSGTTSLPANTWLKRLQLTSISDGEDLRSILNPSPDAESVRSVVPGSQCRQLSGISDWESQAAESAPALEWSWLLASSWLVQRTLWGGCQDLNRRRNKETMRTEVVRASTVRI